MLLLYKANAVMEILIIPKKTKFFDFLSANRFNRKYFRPFERFLNQKSVFSVKTMFLGNTPTNPDPDKRHRGGVNLKKGAPTKDVGVNFEKEGGK